MYINTNSTSDKSKRLPSKRRSSPCIFQVVVSLSIRSFRTYFLIIFSCFQSDFSVKSIKLSTRNSKYFIYILQQLLSMRRTHVGNSTWINSISPELCPPLTCERACSGNEITLSQNKGGFPLSGKSRSIDFLRSLSFQMRAIKRNGWGWFEKKVIAKSRSSDFFHWMEIRL
jgi:hypothetical protein